MQFRSIVSLACAVSLFTGSALASAVYTRRVDELTMERDIYASQKENWMNKAVERKETIEQMQTEVEQLTDTLAADLLCSGWKKCRSNLPGSQPTAVLPPGEPQRFQYCGASNRRGSACHQP